MNSALISMLKSFEFELFDSTIIKIYSFSMDWRTKSCTSRFYFIKEFSLCPKVAMMFILKGFFFWLRSLFWVLHILFFIFNSVASLLSNLCLQLRDNLIHFRTIEEKVKGFFASISSLKQVLLNSPIPFIILTTKFQLR